MPTAVLVDGGYLLKRFPSCFPQKDRHDARDVAKTVFEIALAHLTENPGKRGEVKHQLHRIFSYDCAPLSKKAHKPVSRESVDFSKTVEAEFRTALHKELRRLRKVALRLGHLSEQVKVGNESGRAEVPV